MDAEKEKEFWIWAEDVKKILKSEYRVKEISDNDLKAFRMYFLGGYDPREAVEESSFCD